jgi:hypothetical protein
VDTINDEGWIKLYRKSVDSQVFQNEGLWKVWTWCLLRANHEDRWVSITTGKGTSEVFVKRGEFVFGRKTAAQKLKMVERTVHKRMLKLQSMRNLVIKSDTHYSIVTIVNYDIYQSTPEEEVTPKVTGKGQASDTNKNDKNEKNTSSSPQTTCPQSEIVNLYHTVLPELPPVKEWTDERQKHLRARWREELKRQDLDWWKRYFEYVRESPFLMGNGSKSWKPNLEWLVKKGNLINVIEGKYHEK